jgi:hypothetical protein
VELAAPSLIYVKNRCTRSRTPARRSPGAIVDLGQVGRGANGVSFPQFNEERAMCFVLFIMFVTAHGRAPQWA